MYVFKLLWLELESSSPSVDASSLSYINSRQQRNESRPNLVQLIFTIDYLTHSQHELIARWRELPMQNKLTGQQNRKTHTL